MTFEERVTTEQKRLYVYFQQIPKNQLETAEGLIQNCAFMRVALEDLQQEIIRVGAVEEYVHGKDQRGLKASASLQAYQGTMKLYTSAISKLLRLLPKEVAETIDLRTQIEAELDAYMN